MPSLLESNHTAENCQLGTCCAVENCDRRPHAVIRTYLAHKHADEGTEELTPRRAAVASWGDLTRLGFVPVEMWGKSRGMLTYAPNDRESSFELAGDTLH